MVAHGKRGGGGGSKKVAAANAANPEESFIVFTNAKDGDKGKQPASKASTDKNGATSGAANEENAPKRPDTRKLIGGASWTGKLPVNMLSEHCQKQKWDKPEYTMVGVSSCMLDSVTYVCLDQITGWLFFYGNPQGRQSEDQREGSVTSVQTTSYS
jgi:hypothetical protein